MRWLIVFSLIPSWFGPLRSTSPCFGWTPDPDMSTMIWQSAPVARADGSSFVAFTVVLRNNCSEPLSGWPVALMSAHGSLPPGQSDQDRFIPLASNLTGPDGSATFEMRSTAVDLENTIGLFCNGETNNCWPSRLVASFTLPLSLYLPLIVSIPPPAAP